MIDLHAHSLLSDGALLPSELVRRASEKGYSAIAITDHVDSSNIDLVIPQIVNVTNKLSKYWKDIKVIAGIEITHVPLEEFKDLVKFARNSGIKLVIAHGETISEPVLKGTNKAAIRADIDILAHPGLITEEDVRLAKERNIFLEITARATHAFTNGHVAALAQKIGAGLVLNTDTHAPNDLISIEFAKNILKGCGVHSPEDCFTNSKGLLKKLL